MMLFGRHGYIDATRRIVKTTRHIDAKSVRFNSVPLLLHRHILLVLIIIACLHAKFCHAVVAGNKGLLLYQLLKMWLNFTCQ